MKIAAIIALAMTLIACNNNAERADVLVDDMQKFRFEEAGLPARDYYVFDSSSGVAAKSASGAERPLIMYLHGCQQTAIDAAMGTRWNQFAQLHDLIIVYPEQLQVERGDFQHELEDGNSLRCWNWFRSEHINRGGGEPATLAGIVARVIEDFEVDSSRVYVLGGSAGAMMSGIMAATYPELFAAAGIIAGCGYPVCSDPSGSLAYASIDQRVTSMPMIIWHGSADEVAPLAGGIEGVQQWLATNDWLDDGLPNNSVSSQASEVEHRGLDESLIAGLGNIDDPCLQRESNSPCLGALTGFEEDYPYSRFRYNDAQGELLMEFWLVHGLSHNYAGGAPEGSHTDPLGPDITENSYAFFMRHQRISD